MKAFGKIALLAAGAASLAVSVPAQARHNDWGRDRIDVGDIIAGALIIGGVAAVASAVADGGRGYDRDYNRGYDNRYRERGYGYDDGGRGYYQNGYSSRSAVEQCVRAAQRSANRYGWSRVTDVTRIDRIRGGYEVVGRLVVEDRGYRGGRDYRDYRGDGYGRGWDRNDRYGYHYDRYNDGYDKGRFSCVTRYGQVEDINLSGLRGTSRYY
jgi:hypothetical protein